MRYLWMVILLMMSTACGRPHLAPADYVKWVTNPENGMIKTKELPPFKLELRYLPPESAILSYFGEKGLNRATLDSILSEKSGVHEFQLRLGSIHGTEFLRTGLTDFAQYHQRLEYYTSHVQEDLKLISGKDTMDCSLSHFERAYGVAPYNTLVLAFEQNHDIEEGFSLVYNDRVLGLGITKFTIEQKDLEKIPTLKL